MLLRNSAAACVIALAASSACQAGANTAADAPASACPVTLPNGQRFTDEPAGGNHGNEYLVVALSPGGVVVFTPNGPGSRLRDGSLVMKFWWWRRVRGTLTIEGRRLDAPAAPLRSSIPAGYGGRGFQASGLIFPAPGCWEVTGRVGSGSLTFVTRVEVRD